MKEKRRRKYRKKLNNEERFPEGGLEIYSRVKELSFYCACKRRALPMHKKGPRKDTLEAEL